MRKLLPGSISLLLTLSLLVGTPAVAAGEQPSEEARARHLLNRISFGPTSEELDRVLKVGVENYINEQLEPEKIPLPETIAALTKEPALSESPAHLFLNYGRPAFEAMERAAKKRAPLGQDKAIKKEIQQLVKDNFSDIYTQVTDARLKRSMYSPRQLEEVMTDFWYNHFNVSIDKGLDHLWVGSYEQEAIRPYALGKFRDLLGATAHHAAMLFYLDNWQNTAPNRMPARVGGKKFAGLNENYARELMELHTLGVDGGYSQTDVIELARVLTGHGIVSVKSVRLHPGGMNSKFGYYFDPDRHDFTEKKLLGRVIKGSGISEVEEALDILSTHPSTARFVSYKLAQNFVADEPPATLVDKMAATFKTSDGDIKEVLKTLFRSSEFWDSKYYSAKFKSPYRYMISGLRAGDATVKNTKLLLGFLKLQGMPLYQCLTPDGYKNTEKAWLSSGGLLQRINFATAYGAGRLPAAHLNSVSSDQLMRVIGIKPSDPTGQVVQSSPAPLRLSLLYGSPEFMKY